MAGLFDAMWAPNDVREENDRARAQAEELAYINAQKQAMGMGQQQAPVGGPMGDPTRIGMAEIQQDYDRLFGAPQQTQQRQQAPARSNPVESYEMALINSGDPRAMQRGLDMRERRMMAPPAAAKPRRIITRPGDGRQIYEDTGEYVLPDEIFFAGQKPAAREKSPWEPVGGTLERNVYSGEYRDRKATPMEQSALVEQTRDAGYKHEDFTQEYSDFNDLIDRAETQATSGATGPLNAAFGGNLPMFGGDDVKALAGTISTIKSRLTIEKLNELKSQSATGATGMGALSDTELNVLQDAVATLDQTASPETIKANLNLIRWHLNKMKYKSDREWRDAGGQDLPGKTLGTMDDYMKEIGSIPGVQSIEEVE